MNRTSELILTEDEKELANSTRSPGARMHAIVAHYNRTKHLNSNAIEMSIAAVLDYIASRKAGK